MAFEGMFGKQNNRWGRGLVSACLGVLHSIRKRARRTTRKIESSPRTRVAVPSQRLLVASLSTTCLRSSGKQQINRDAKFNRSTARRSQAAACQRRSDNATKMSWSQFSRRRLTIKSNNVGRGCKRPGLSRAFLRPGLGDGGEKARSAAAAEPRVTLRAGL